MSLTYPSQPTIKRLFAVSGNNCAFPKCPLPLVDESSGKVTGKICHIKAQSPGGARYDENQTDEERQGFKNLVLMCPIHHDVIDSDEDSYTVERLNQIKLDHEKSFQNGEEPNDATVNALIDNSQGFINASATSQNQSGGQTANQITNYLATPQTADDWEREIKFKRYNHDLEIFRQSNEILDEDKLETLCYWLMCDDSYRKSHKMPLNEYERFFKKASSSYLNDMLNESCSKLVESVTLLNNFLGKHFFYKPLNNDDDDDMRFCLYPDLNIDRAVRGGLINPRLYEQFADEMVDLVDKVKEAYKNYRKMIKENLFV